MKVYNVANIFLGKNRDNIKQPEINKFVFKTENTLAGDIFVPSQSQKINKSNISFGQDEKVVVKPEIKSFLTFLDKDPNASITDVLDTMYNSAMKDGLTGLNNKRALFVDLTKTVTEMKQQGKPLSIAMFDMDNFKAVNDLLGYDVGDKFIKTVGQEINSAAQKHDFEAYRFGGEEFFVLMPDTDVETASRISEEVRINISNNELMKSYYDKYMARAAELIQGLEAEQAPFDAFNKALIKYEILKQDLDEYERTESPHSEMSEFMQNKVISNSTKVKDMLFDLLMQAHDKASSEEEKNLIKAFVINNLSDFPLQKVLFHNMKIYGNLSLKNYLNSVFNKGAQIAQIEGWIHNMKRAVNGAPQGFSITAGVKKFDNLDIPVEQFIEQTGQVLSDGKKRLKGKVYS